MPCDTIRTVQVDIGKLDPTLAAAAIAALGWSGSVSYSNGKLSVRGNIPDAQEQVKQAYSAEVVKSQAKKYGWQLKQTAPFKFEVVKK
jgi:hypothetical protein